MANYQIPAGSKQLNWQVAMRRENALPLDISSVFSSHAKALEYIQGNLLESVGAPYVGQLIAVEENDTEPMKVYCINKTGSNVLSIKESCTELGEGKIKSIEVNDTVMEIDEDGIVDISLTDANTKISEDIEVNGGPLASLLTNAGITAITADMTVADVFSKLLRKENYPTPGYVDASVSASISTPNISISIDDDINTSSIMEVGTNVTMEPMSFSATTISSAKACKVTGLTYGYSSTKDGDINTSTEIIGGNLSSGVTNQYTRKITVTGFTGGNTVASKPSDLTAVALSNLNIPKTNIGNIAAGENTIKVSITGGTATVSCDNIDSQYIVSNFGGRSDANKTVANKAKNTASKVPTSTETYTITGKYMYFIGDSFEYTDAKDFDSTSIRALNKKTGFLNVSGETTAVDSTALKSDGGSIVVACPKGYTLKRIENGIGDELLSLFTSKGEISVETGSISTIYNVYVYPITNSAQVDFKNVVIGK